MIDVNTTANVAATTTNGNMGMNNVPQISNNSVMDNTGVSPEKEKEIRESERNALITLIQKNLTAYCKNFYTRNSDSRLSEEMVDGFLIRLYNVLRLDS